MLLNILKTEKLKKKKKHLRLGFIVIFRWVFWVLLGGFFNANSGRYSFVLASLVSVCFV